MANVSNLASALRGSGLTEEERRIKLLDQLGGTTGGAGSDWLAGLGTAVTTPYSTASRSLFSEDYRGNPLTAATAEQAGTLGKIRDAYSKGDMDTYNTLKNGLQTSGQFVSVAGVNGATPTGYMVGSGGPTNGHMAMVLDGKATGGLPIGSVLEDGYGGAWRVSDDAGTLTPWRTGGATGAAGTSGAGGVPGTGGVPSSGGGTTHQQLLSSYSGGGVTEPWGGTMPTFDPFSYGDAPTYGGSQYDNRRDRLLDQLEGSKFSYDPANDPVWQAYQKQYRREGQRATEDALGRAAASTGGVASSYAAQAASQAGNYYAAQLSDRLPQVYQDAYNRYLQEYERQLGLADTYNSLGQQEYNRYKDTLNQFNTDRNFAYGVYSDDYNRQMDQYGTQYNEYLKEMDRRASEDRTAYEREQDAKQWAWNENERDYNRTLYADQTAYERAMDAEKMVRQAWQDSMTGKQYSDQRTDAAWKFLFDNQFVAGEYADILGYPAGTTLTQILQDLGIDPATLGLGVTATTGNGGSTPAYTPPAPEPTPEPKEPETTETDNGDTWPNGKMRTEGASKLLARIAYEYSMGMLTPENIKRLVLDAAGEKSETNKFPIEDYEIKLLLDLFGIPLESPSEMNPNVEGSIRQYTK